MGCRLGQTAPEQLGDSGLRGFPASAEDAVILGPKVGIHLQTIEPKTLNPKPFNRKPRLPGAFPATSLHQG